MIWKKSHMKWLKDEYENTYFHICFCNRTRINEIACIKLNGRKLTGVKDIK